MNLALQPQAAYPAWDMTRPLLPARSRLYHLPPVGVGTARVESLTSYVMRLAEAHAVDTGTLFARELVPPFNRSYLLTQERKPRASALLFLKDIHALNGASYGAAAFSDVLASLTRRPHLHLLTMLPLKGVLSLSDLTRIARAWCPDCYAERRARDEPVYDALTWTLRCVTACARHRRRLETCCPYCGRSSPWLTNKARAGHCFRCQGWLGATTPAEARCDAAPGADLSKAVQIAAVAGELLSQASQLEGSQWLTRQNFVARLSGHIYQLTKGNVAAFARFIGSDYLKVRQLKAGTNLPTLADLLHLLNRLRLTAADFFSGRPAAVPQPAQRDIYLPHKKPGVESVLRAALTDPTRPSLGELVGRLGYKREALLRGLYPELCRAVCARHRVVRPAKDFHRDRLYDDQALRSALQAAVGETPAPALQALAERLGYKYAATLRQRAPDLYQALRERRRTHLREKAEETKAILQAALAEDPPPTLRTVQLRLGARSDGTLKYRHRELCRAIVERHRAFRQAATLAVRPALEAALTEEPPPSVRQVARRARRNVSGLYRREPELCRQVAARRLEHVARRAEAKRQAVYLEIRQAVARLHAAGIYPSHCRVESEMSAPYLMRHEEGRAAYREAKRALGIGV
jgi:hypothetical protein